MLELISALLGALIIAAAAILGYRGAVASVKNAIGRSESDKQDSPSGSDEPDNQSENDKQDIRSDSDKQDNPSGGKSDSQSES